MSVINILNRWRQFSRRYFWLHLLWGTVATAFGVPTTFANTEQSNVLKTPVASLHRLISAHLIPTHNHHDYVLSQNSKRRNSIATIDYWQQHELRTAIRHLFYHLTPMKVLDVKDKEQHHQQLILLNSLHSILTSQSNACPEGNSKLVSPLPITTLSEKTPALWLAQVQGIRAGP